MFLAIFGPFERLNSLEGVPQRLLSLLIIFFRYPSIQKILDWRPWADFGLPHYTTHHHVRGGGGGAHINNNFSEFFPSGYNIFFIIEKSRSSFETIWELLVVTTDPV